MSLIIVKKQHLVKPPLHVELDLSLPLFRGLVGAWTFQEGCGNTLFDRSGFGNHGTVSGSAVWMVGEKGWAMLFDFNSATWVEITVSDSILSATQNYTCAVLAQMPDNASLGDHMLANLWGEVGSASWRMSINVYSGYNPMHLYHIIHDGSANTTYEGSINLYPQRSWHLLAVTQSGSDLKLYVDGKLDSSFTASIPSGNANWARIGHDSDSTESNHIIAAVFLWNRALTADEVRELYEMTML